MIPTYFLELKDTSIAKDVYKKYFDEQYPETNDCLKLDNQIGSIKKDIDEISQRQLANYKECNCSQMVKTPCVGTSFGCFMGFKHELNPEYLLSRTIRDRSLTYLKALLLKKTNLRDLADCKNQIANQQAEETAQIFSTTSAKNEAPVIADTNKKMFLLVGVAATVVVTTVIILMNRKK